MLGKKVGQTEFCTAARFVFILICVKNLNRIHNIIEMLSNFPNARKRKHSLEQLSESTPECVPEEKGVHLVRLLQIEDDDWLEVVKQRISFHQKLAGIINDTYRDYKYMFYCDYDCYKGYKLCAELTILEHFHEKLEDYIRKMSEYIIKYEMNH